MDISRPDLARKKKLRQALYPVTAVLAVAVVTLGVSRLEPAAPRVDRDTIYLDTVQRGPMVRQVRGTGTLVPEQIRWIPATTDGTVERIVIRPGALVAPARVILELSNPELEQSTLEARLNLEAAEARYSNRQVEVERELLNQRATLATTEAQLKTARLQADADGQLFAQGLVSSLQLQQSQSAEQEFDTRYALEQERLQMATDTVEAQLAVEQAEVDRLRTLYELRQQQGGRPARAGRHAGRPAAGAARGRAAHRCRREPGAGGRPDGPEGRAARRGDAGQGRPDRPVGRRRHPQRRHPGPRHPHRPGGENGTVTVDVALDGALPRGARPDLTVDGTIELERMDDVLFVGRPVFGQEESVVSLFRLEAVGTHASRMRVSLGRASVNTIEVLDGLQPGDRVVLSDMSAWDQFDRVRIE